ncbi:MAG: fatty acid desaturase [Acidimicrobiales bacterium]|nr:fatty acid desaturase [Acidimicrobiales bacterium]
MGPQTAVELNDASVTLPTLAELGPDLNHTSRTQQWVTLGRPFVAIGVYIALAQLGWWPLAPIAVFFVFVTVVTATHDVVHRSLGLSRRATDWWLFILGGLLGASGHSYRATHLRHHAVFPGPDDPEGHPARMTFWQSVLQGPVFLAKLWVWSYRRANDGGAKAWLLAEASVAPLALIIGFTLWPQSIWPSSFGLLAYVVMVINGAWVFPLMTVHLPHRGYGETPLTQTHTVRDPIISRLFLELTYHLEHHLFPSVPTHNLAELAKRLEPALEKHGVVPQRLFFRQRA